MSKHTPGPWHWDSDQIKGDPLGRVRYRVTAIGKTVTQCYYSSSDEQAEWDARLIAAAPELLAVLHELEESARYWSEYDVPLGIVDRISAAIAKATGEKA